MKKTAFLALMLLIFPMLTAQLARADTMISDCAVLNQTGETYLLTQDIGTDNADLENWWCFGVTADNITLDCQNHFILDNNTDAQGMTSIDIETNGTTIKNCNLIEENPNFTTASEIYIYVNALENISIINNTLSVNASHYEYRNFWIQNGLGDNRSFNSTILVNNTLDPSFILLEASVGDEIIISWNDSANGNYWTNSTHNGYSDTCNCINGICDEPFNITDYLLVNIEAKKGETFGNIINNIDYLPLCNAGPEPTSTPNPLENLTIAYTYCLTNTTLALINHTSPETGNVTTAYVNCMNGCDNTTATCQMAPIYQGLLSFGVIVVFIIILLGLDKVLKR